MNIDLRPFLVLWCLLAATVIALLAWRKVVARNEDDTLHVLHGAISQQASLAQKLEQIDKWGKVMTVVTVIFGLLVAALYGYQFWIQAAQIPTGA